MNNRQFLEINEERSGIPPPHRTGNKQQDKDRDTADPSGKGFAYKIIKLFKQAVFRKNKADKDRREIAYKITEQVIYYRVFGQEITYCANKI